MCVCVSVMCMRAHDPLAGASPLLGRTGPYIDVKIYLHQKESPESRLKELPGQLHVAVVRRQHQREAAGLRGAVRICPALEEEVDLRRLLVSIRRQGRYVCIIRRHSLAILICLHAQRLRQASQ